VVTSRIRIRSVGSLEQKGARTVKRFLDLQNGIPEDNRATRFHDRAEKYTRLSANRVLIASREQGILVKSEDAARPE